MGPTVGIFVDYESPLARVVAGRLWSGLSAAALGSEGGYPRITARWESLWETRSPSELEGPLLHVFVVGQDRPDAVDAVAAVGEPGAPCLYGMVVAVPERPSPLSGSLLYQGVEKLTGGGVKAGLVEPAPLRASPGECELYAGRLLERLRTVRGEV